MTNEEFYNNNPDWTIEKIIKVKLKWGPYLHPVWYTGKNSSYDLQLYRTIDGWWLRFVGLIVIHMELKIMKQLEFKDILQILSITLKK